MINLQDRVNAFVELGLRLKKLSGKDSESDTEFSNVLNQGYTNNKWFTRDNQKSALQSLSLMLKEDKLKNWVNGYPELESKTIRSKNVGIICAGNIPAVAFHDMLCVILSGNKAVLKFSSEDNVLFPFIINLLCQVEPALKEQIEVVVKLSAPDAVIATGSNNTARYFQYYFGKYPHIIRKNRNSIAVLTGEESAADFKKLAIDIFSYFGLGCRNVSKLYVPHGYSFNTFFESIEEFGAELMNHNKYMNNYDYHKALFLLEAIPFLTNNFLILKEDKKIATPVSVLHFEYYKNQEDVKQLLAFNLEHIQCILSQKSILGEEVGFGNSQIPLINDYADGVDTLKFLTKLEET